MNTINLVGKACSIYDDYETTEWPTVLEKIVIRNGKKYSNNKISYNYLKSLTQAGQDTRRSSN